MGPSSRRTQRASKMPGSQAQPDSGRPRLRSRPRPARSSRSDIPSSFAEEPRGSPIVEARAATIATPLIPALRLHAGTRRLRQFATAFGLSLIPAGLGDRGKPVEDRDQEPGVPDALPVPPAPTRFVPSFQSPVPISGSPWDPRLMTHARGHGDSGHRAWPSRPRSRGFRNPPPGSGRGGVLQERQVLVEHGLIPGRRHGSDSIREGEPEHVVGDSGPHTPADGDATNAGHPLRGTVGVPPRSRWERVSSGAPSTSSRQSWKLIAEAERPARLVERRARSEPAAQDLIEQPTVEHQVQGGVGGLDLNGGQYPIPTREHRLERGVWPSSAPARVESSREPVRASRLSPRKKTISFVSRGSAQTELGSPRKDHSAAPARPDSSTRRSDAGASSEPFPPEEFQAIRGQRPRTHSSTSAKATARQNPPGTHS